MIKDLRAGISFSDAKTQIAVVEFRLDGTDLKYLEEIARPADQPLTTLPDATIKAINSYGKLSKLTVSIESSNGAIQIFPMDASLTPVEVEEHLDWEWKNFFPTYSSGEFVKQSKLVKPVREDQKTLVLSNIVKQSLINEITTAFEQYKLAFSSIELIPNFAENVLRFIHPEMRMKNTALVGVSPTRLDVYVFEAGRLSAYKYALNLQPQAAVEYLAVELLEFLPETLYVYGSGLSYEWQKALKSSLGVVVSLNPFRKFRITPDVKNYSRYIGHEHRFCGCIGGILEAEPARLGK